MTMTLLSLLRACLVQKYQRFWPTLVLFPLLLPSDSYSKVSACCDRREDAVKTCQHAAILLHVRKQCRNFRALT